MQFLALLLYRQSHYPPPSAFEARVISPRSGLTAGTEKSESIRTKKVGSGFESANATSMFGEMPHGVNDSYTDAARQYFVQKSIVIKLILYEQLNLYQTWSPSLLIARGMSASLYVIASLMSAIEY